uniref:FLZ-type domain-containing protein n=1 Tax=Opuntia streptacantha TaxID=393608 RepID=A0A7C8ZY38_OPUST
MLRKRSRAVTSKESMVGEHSNNLWLPPEKTPKPNSFLSPRFFKSFFTFSSETESIISPTSILDTKPFSALANTFWADKKIPTPKTFSENKHFWDQPNNSKGIGIALVDVEDSSEINISSSTKQQKRKLVVFGSQLRIQVPKSSVFPSFSPVSPVEFGINTPRSNLKLSEENSDEKDKENVSLIDIEQSEDYTCVISHGPNPKTTHIFGNCIVESCCGMDGSSSFSSKRNGYLHPFRNSIASPENFLSFCHHCKKQLGIGKDIFMYRGEKAFCSQECRSQEMLFDGLES